jgi:hypothetical protein
METKKIPLIAATMGLLALMTPFAAAEILFSDDFSGDGSDLNDSTPNVTTGGATWVACPAFKRDGLITPSSGSATLAFSPVDGEVYTLDLSLSGVTGNGNWIALGFANGQSTGAASTDRFITGNVMGTAWMLFRGDASVNANQTWLGLGTGTNGGTTSSSPFTDPLTNVNPGGDVDLRIVLDTTGGAGTWTATWLARRPTDGNYTEMRPATPMLTESMNSIGIALSSGAVDGTIESFSLSTDTESASALAITAIDYASETEQVTLTWRNIGAESYAVTYSTDLTNWDSDLDDSVTAEVDEILDDGDQITVTFNIAGLTGGGMLYFRVEQ